MRRIGLGSVALVALALTSQPASSQAPPIWNWTGFYVGANVGYSWGQARTDFDAMTTTTIRTRVFVTGGVVPITDVTTGPFIVNFADRGDADVNGWLGGVQAGYSRQSGMWVGGFETDIQLTGQRGGTSFCFPAASPCPVGSGFASVDYHLKWFGTARARLGVLASPQVLLYLTGGLAYGGIDADFSVGIVGLPAASGTTGVTRAGLTGGGGVEAQIGGGWSVKLEYLYVDFGSFNAGSGGVAGTSTVILPGVPPRFTTVIDTTATATATARARLIDHILRFGLNFRI